MTFCGCRFCYYYCAIHRIYRSILLHRNLMTKYIFINTFSFGSQDDTALNGVYNSKNDVINTKKCNKLIRQRKEIRFQRRKDITVHLNGRVHLFQEKTS